MDVPQCNVCHNTLDEGERQPRHLGCGHDACTACIKALIKIGSIGSLQCPVCRKVIKVKNAENLHINHGVVQVLKLFRDTKMSVYKQNEGTTANIKNIKNVCSIHNSSVNMRCIPCNELICEKCKEYHILDIGCRVEECNDPLMKVKEEYKEKVETTLSSIKNNVESLSSQLSGTDNEKKRLEEEIQKLGNLRNGLQKMLDDGTKALTEVEATAVKVEKASTSEEFNENIRIANELHQFSQIWFKKNQYSLLEKLKSDKEVYVSMDINGKNNHSKMSIEEGDIYQHCFRIRRLNIKSFRVFPYEQIQAVLPAAPDLVFLDLAIYGEVKGRVTIELRQDLPIYRDCIPYLFTGKEGYSLLGINFENSGMFNLSIGVDSIKNRMNQSNPNSKSGPSKAQSSIHDWVNVHKIKQFHIYHDTLPGHEQSIIQPYQKYELLGQVESGLDIAKLCSKHKRHDEVSVVDCGLVIRK